MCEKYILINLGVSVTNFELSCSLYTIIFNFYTNFVCVRLRALTKIYERKWEPTSNWRPLENKFTYLILLRWEMGKEGSLTFLCSFIICKWQKHYFSMLKKLYVTWVCWRRSLVKLIEVLLDDCSLASKEPMYGLFHPNPNMGSLIRWWPIKRISWCHWEATITLSLQATGVTIGFWMWCI